MKSCVIDEELMRFVDDQAWGLLNLELTWRSRSLMIGLYS